MRREVFIISFSHRLSSLYGIVLSDGQFQRSFYLTGKLKHLTPFTIIKVKKHRYNLKKNVIIEKFKIVVTGRLVRVKLGNPAQIDSDENIPDTLGDKLTTLR